MKKILVLICAISVCNAGVTNDTAKAQHSKRGVHVQGHPHEVLTKKLREGTWTHPKTSKKPGDLPPPEDVCWVDERGLNTSWEVDSAYLIVKWTDGKGDDVPLVWGYRFNPISIYSGDTSYIAHHTIDMIRAVANSDTRFSVLIQYTGTSGHNAGGFGYNWTIDQDDQPVCSSIVPVVFNLASAQSNVAFTYSGTLDCNRNGQLALPPDPVRQAQWAIQTGAASGFIDHPFNVAYGYPAYDYDYWILDTADPNAASHSWQAGWAANGYWAFYVAHNWQVPDVNDPDAYASLGITYQPLLNHDVHGFIFNLNFGSYDFSGDINSHPCACPRCTK
jgi:hypothetical protein